MKKVRKKGKTPNNSIKKKEGTHEKKQSKKEIRKTPRNKVRKK